MEKISEKKYFVSYIHNSEKVITEPIITSTAKSRKYREIFKVKRSTRHGRSQQLEHRQVPKRDGTRCPEG